MHKSVNNLYSEVYFTFNDNYTDFETQDSAYHKVINETDWLQKHNDAFRQGDADIIGNMYGFMLSLVDI